MGSGAGRRGTTALPGAQRPAARLGRVMGEAVGALLTITLAAQNVVDAYEAYEGEDAEVAERFPGLATMIERLREALK